MTAAELWHVFCQEMKIKETIPYEAWAFSGAAGGDALLELVLQERKFGTASAYDEYLAEDALDELPQIGDYSVLLRSNGEAACVLRNYDVYICPFEEVPSFHAYAEGEADCSLGSWRDIHAAFFRPRLQAIGKPMHAKSLVVCEKFTVEYTAEWGTEKSDDIFFVEASLAYAQEIIAYRAEMLQADSTFD